MKNFKFIVLVLFVSACTSQSMETTIQSTEPLVYPKITHSSRPAFSSDSALLYIRQQCEFGPRIPNSPAHDSCALYLEKKLESFGCFVRVQNFEMLSYEGKKLKGKNIIGQINPKMIKRVMLLSHWDSRPFCDNDDQSNWYKPVMGANDGASGVGVLLEVARQIQISEDSLGVDIVFLDLEDSGQPSFESGEQNDTWCLGAQYLAAHPYYRGKPQMGILLDMVGGPNPFFGFDHVSQYYAMKYLQDVWDEASKLGYSANFVAMESGAIVDDHYYINKIAQIPTIDIVDYNYQRGFPDVWHTVNDVVEHIEKRSLQMVGEVVLKYLRTQK